MNNSDSRQSSAHLAVSTEFHSKQTIAVWVNQARLSLWASMAVCITMPFMCNSYLALSKVDLGRGVGQAHNC